MRATRWLLVGVAAPLLVLLSFAPAAAGRGARGATPSTEPPAGTVPPDTAPATTTTIAASGEDTGLGPDVSVPQQSPSLISAPQVQSGPIVPVPAGCPTSTTTTAVFFGTVVAMDFQTAQFTVHSIRAGSLAGFVVGDQIQVRYGPDVRFLDVGTTYIVGASPDPQTGVLSSKVREAEPLFGGDAVAGADDSDVKCPTVEDPVMTLTEQATPVETGLLTPLRKAKGALLLAVLRPLGVALAVLIALVLVKHLIFATARSLRSNTVTERTVVRVPRARRPRARHTRLVKRRPRGTPAGAAPEPGGAPPSGATWTDGVLVRSGHPGSDGSPEAGA